VLVPSGREHGVADSAFGAARAGDVLEVRDLEVSYGTGAGRVVAVRGVSLVVGRGEKLGVVGESGSGKTSFGMAIPGLLGGAGQVSGGEISLAGTRVTDLTPRELARIRARVVSVIFQDPLNALDPVRTVYSQVAEAVRFRRPDGQRMKRRVMRAAVAELLDDCEIRDPVRVMAQYPHEISGGMRQRVMIAIALAGDAELVIADEPTTALDVTTQAQILSLLERVVTERGLAVILITHSLAVVSGFCDRVVVMYGGRIVEDGTAQEITGHPQHPYTEGLVASIPSIGMTKSRLASIPGMPPDLRESDHGCAFRPRCRLAEEICAATVPDLTGLGGSRRVRCHVVVRDGQLAEPADGGRPVSVRGVPGDR
jgi:oligopeptide/dipeptide ABC transporter ATP-binding protein